MLSSAIFVQELFMPVLFMNNIFSKPGADHSAIGTYNPAAVNDYIIGRLRFVNNNLVGK
jgi:hypothetical protein